MARRVARGAWSVVLVAAALVIAVATPLHAQDKLRAQREELDRIRAERADLERRMLDLRANVHDLSEEVANLNARRAATERLVAAVELLKPTVVAMTPSYALHLAEWAEDRGKGLANSSVSRVMVAGEPGGGEPAMRAKLEAAWGASVTEAMGIGDISVEGLERSNDRWLSRGYDRAPVRIHLDVAGGVGDIRLVAQ